jgi:16S rRNA (cytosine967-C5)-methyltransferase
MRRPSQSASRRPKPAARVRSAAKPGAVPAAELTAAVTPSVLHSVFQGRERLSPALTKALSGRDQQSTKERFRIERALAALLRWWGWIEPLQLPRVEERLLLGWLLDSTEIGPLAAVWAARAGRRTEGLSPVGDAPNWTARAEGLKRFVGGRPVNADPWQLFPAWLRSQLPVPPGDGTPKARRLEFLATLQSRPPLWLGVRGHDEKAVWTELREAGLKPWIHRRLATAAKFPAETDSTAFEAVQARRLVAHDLASQAVGIVCDPDPGERWWDLNGERGLHALHLAALMKGRGVVVSTFERKSRQHAAGLFLRPSSLHNISTRLWDGRHPPGKAERFDGVLVDGICSGVGSWRRHPDARWVVTGDQIPAMADRQRQWLDVAAAAVRPGGTLVYTVATVTRAETVDVVSAFLETHTEFEIQPFANPLDDSTTAGTLQIWPQLADCDGRFIARFTRLAKA